MTEGDCHRVRRIIRLGDGGKVEDPLGHVHDLTLFCLAVAHYRLLDLAGGVFKDVDPQLGGGHQNDPTGLGHADAGGHVGVEEQLFDGHDLRGKPADQRLQILLNLEQPLGHGHPRRGVDGPAAQEPGLPPVRLQNAKADDSVAGVDA